ncbi:hypothetical protein Tco_0283841, partial [Tanacetum coccineum]
SNSRVQRIKDNLANHRSALRDVFVPLSEPLSTTALTSTKGTSNIIPATVDNPMAPSTTLAFVSTIIPISIEDYEIVDTDGQDAMNESVANDAAGRRY